MLIRIFRVLSKSDKERFKERFGLYVTKTSGQYIYKLKASDIPHELEKIAQLYFWIDRNIRPAYSELSIIKIFERVYSEHFTEVDQKVEVKPHKELHSGCLQSPDDLDATYREKRGKKSKGQSITVTEIANPDNPINLITDIDVNPNNIDDSKILNKRIDRLKEKTPDLDELHMDGAYGSSDNDRKFEEHDITPVQKDMRGKDPAVPIEIEQTGEDEYIVSCPYQKVHSEKCRKRFKAEFDLSICQKCDKQAVCASIRMKKHRTFYFTRDDYLRKKRLKQRASIPADRLKLRNNVEATINEFVCKMPKGKLKVRGAFKTSIFAFSVAMSVNFGRIYRYIQDKPDMAASCIKYFFEYFKERFVFPILSNIFNIRCNCQFAFTSI